MYIDTICTGSVAVSTNSCSAQSDSGGESSAFQGVLEGAISDTAPASTAEAPAKPYTGWTYAQSLAANQGELATQSSGESAGTATTTATADTAYNPFESAYTTPTTSNSAYTYTYAESVLANQAAAEATAEAAAKSSDAEAAATSSKSASAETTATQETAPVSAPVNTNAKVEEMPPIISSQAPPEVAKYLSGYYPITEDDVVPEIRKLRALVGNTNMAGKTEAERYSFIEQQFKETFGSDFLMARNMNLPSSMFYIIGVEFSDMLGRHIDNPEQVNRERLYGDKSAEEITNEIRSKYPEEMSNKDLLMKVNEMRNAGVLDTDSIRSIGTDGARRLMDTLELMRNYVRHNVMWTSDSGAPVSQAVRDKRWVGMLDKKANAHELFCVFNVWKERGRVSIGGDAAKFLINHLGGELKPDGFFKVNVESDGDTAYWERLMDMMFAEFDDYDEMIRSRMAMLGPVEHIFAADVAVADEAATDGDIAVGEGAGEEGAAAENDEGSAQQEAA